MLEILEFGSQYMEQEAKNKKKAEGLANSAQGQRKSTQEDVHPPNGTDGEAAPAPLPEERTITLSDLINKSDPTKIYPNPKKIGTLLCRLRKRSELKSGEGAAGEVFMAFQAVTSRRCAIKKMTLANQNLKLLLTEIAIMKDSHHPNIVDYIDSYIVEEKLWVVMEYLDGGCLTQILEQFDQMQMQERHIARVCLEVRHSFHFPDRHLCSHPPPPFRALRASYIFIVFTVFTATSRVITF